MEITLNATLNLVNPNSEGSCGYEIIRFPDGQQSIKITSGSFGTSIDLLARSTNPVIIKSRLNTFQDLELIICANQALKEIGVKEVNLYVPYFIGSRSDRRFEYGGINYIKQVIAPIINSQKFNKVSVYDPHSSVLEACIDNFVQYTNFSLVKMAFKDIDDSDDYRSRICLVSPDAGAYKKIFDLAQFHNIKNVITASKVRDITNGKILSTQLPSLEGFHNEMNYIIVDDICDGGRTFIELSKAIKEQKSDAKIYLIVTHGIFSKGYDELMEHIERIYTTNSIKDIEPSETYVKQLNVF